MFKENLEQFLDPADFGLIVTWDGNDYEGIFDNTTVATDINGVVQVDSQQPLILVKEVDFKGALQGDIVHVTDINLNLDADYQITALAPDGTGLVQIALNET
jgi:hypothetical protein